MGSSSLWRDQTWVSCLMSTESQPPEPPGKSLINDFKKHDIQKNTNMVSTEDWFQKMCLPSANTKIHGCSSPLCKMAVLSLLVSTGSAPLASTTCGHTGLTVRFLSVNFSCSFLTCLADRLCRSWEQRCLRRSTVTSREQGSREPARQRSGRLWKQWCLEPATVLRLTNYSTLRSSC